MNLASLFKTRSAWQFVATQGPETEDYGGNPAPGKLHLCLQNTPAGQCLEDITQAPPDTGGSNDGWEPHYLQIAQAIYPQGHSAAPLFKIVTASLAAGNGDQVVVTQLLDYKPASDTFERVYVHSTGTNNNQEVRFISSGPLAGSIVSSEPTRDAPYAYWIQVDSFTSNRAYRQVLRYRSATRYNDGNSLAVIDSEMPNIGQHLGFWRPGMPLPLPEKACPKPRLVHTELWCN
ncbi:hypothetical protein [Paraburkholderia adhaesiva]|uniref:hypothetical protein n=1 Tax=Paraburkholderia adhaesiva TaxID=2883244 RepID=UPI001F2A3A1C|nr:hypothetical protein [Paraburkholderia adhaesiva]